MNRTTKRVLIGAGITAGAVAAVWGVAVAAFHIISHREERRLDAVRETTTPARPAATRDERDPTSAEFALVERIKRGGWPVDGKDFRLGTDANGVYAMVTVGDGVARLRFTGGSSGDYYVESYTGAAFNSWLLKRNFPYEEFHTLATAGTDDAVT